MLISEEQLTTWSHQGAIQSSASTYESIKNCIESINWKEDVNYDTYLQGSYRNSTNIRGNSDVDVVIEFTSVFYSNKDQLPPLQLKEFNEYHSPGKYKLEQFKQSVLNGLIKSFGETNVSEGNKSIKVKGTNGRLDADVICCTEYREYLSFSKMAPNNYVQGITFWQKNDGHQIRNFPKQHYDNGVAKNKEAGTNYRATTRIIKNMKARLVEMGRIDRTLAPSYYVESMLFNVPSGNYNQENYQDIVGLILHYLSTQVNTGQLSRFICQNECRYLFSGNDPHWDEQQCITFIQQLNRLFNEG
ncbi:MAG: nucleotidyltransferase [Bacteroidales bacterium]